MTQRWFSALMESAPDVYFRYAFAPARRFVYVSRAVETLTGYAADAFYSDPAFCVSLIPRDDRRLLRQIVRGRRGVQVVVRLRHRDAGLVRVAVRSVPIVRDGKVVAVEGMASRLETTPSLDFAKSPEPVQQRLAALLCEVHDLLHGSVPRRCDAVPRSTSAPLVVGDIALDSDRMTVTLGGQPAALTSREILLLRFLLQRPGRVVTRRQLLSDVWGYQYSGDDRTVDVHVSRLRRKLPPLRRFLRAVKHVGYCFDPSDEASSDVRVANS